MNNLQIKKNAIEFLCNPKPYNCYVLQGDNQFLLTQVKSYIAGVIPGIKVLLDTNQNQDNLLMALQEQDLFCDAQHCIITIDKKPKNLNALLKAIQISPHSLLLQGDYINKLVTTAAYKGLQKELLEIQANSKSPWFSAWLSWQAGQFNLQLSTPVERFVIEEMSNNPLPVLQWLQKIAFNNIDNKIQTLEIKELKQLNHYHQKQELLIIIQSALAGDIKKCTSLLQDLIQSPNNQLGLLIWLTANFLYQLIALKTNTNGYNNRLYLANQYKKYMQNLVASTSIAVIFSWLNKLKNIERLRKEATNDHWQEVISLYKEVCNQNTKTINY